MTELLRNAWNGWRAYTDPGKLAALLLVSLVFLWIYYKRVPRKEFLIYTTMTAVCCIFPVTAAALMLYQTRFYDYEWIWSIVPLTAMVSYGVVLFVTDILKEQTRGDRKRKWLWCCCFWRRWHSAGAWALSHGTMRESRRHGGSRRKCWLH